MRRCVLVSVLFLLLASCSTENTVPKDVIAIPQMKFIFYDMLRAQELATLTYPKDTTAAKFKTTELYQQVFAVYKISKDDYFKSFHFYESHPDKIQILFDSVSAYATRKRQALYLQMR